MSNANTLNWIYDPDNRTVHADGSNFGDSYDMDVVVTGDCATENDEELIRYALKARVGQQRFLLENATWDRAVMYAEELEVQAQLGEA